MWLHFGGIEFVQGWQLRLMPLALILGGLALLPRTREWITARKRFTRRGRRRTTVLLAMLAVAVPLAIFIAQGSSARPTLSDEFSYTLQAQMLARGRLWGPAHPLPEFFTSFQVVASPVYGSIYLPGVALWSVPWAWLDRLVGTATFNPLLGGALLAGAGVVVGIYRCTSELARDDRIGLLAASIPLFVPDFRGLATMVTGFNLAAMFGLGCIFAYLRWHRAARRETRESGRRTLGWACVAGLCVGWGVIVRPMDLLAFAAPVLALVTFAARVPWRRKVASLGVAAAMTLPFALLLLPGNRAFTGSWTSTPFGWYADTYLPGTGYGVGIDRPLDAAPPNAAALAQLSYRDFARPFVIRRTTEETTTRLGRNLNWHLTTALPHGAMLWALFGPFLLAALRPRLWRFAVLLGLPWAIAQALYLPYGFYLPHYAIATQPSVVASVAAMPVALGIAAHRVTRRPIGPAVGIATVVAGLALGTRGVPFMENLFADKVFQVRWLLELNRKLPREVPTPAVVFFSPPVPDVQTLQTTLVYNMGVIAIDDAFHVRAHDLGERNLDLVRHYAATQPARVIYHYDARDGTLRRLGRADDLAAEPEATAATFAALSAWWREEYARRIAESDAYVRGL